MVECKRCGSDKVVKNGFIREKQRYLCKQCGCHFIEGDQRGSDNTLLLKTLCKLFQALGIKQYITIGKYLNRDTSLIYRWMHEDAFRHKCRIQDYSVECYTTDKLFEEISDSGGIKYGNPIFLTQNVVDDLYIAVIVQRREKQ